MNITLQSNLATFNALYARYLETTSKLPQVAMESKLNDLGLALYRQFRAKKWGGPGPKIKGLARSEFDARVAQGGGIKLRKSLMDEYLAARASLRANRDTKTVSGIMARVNLWRKFVGKELAKRQAGIGILAASFLWFRKRKSQAKGTYVVRNKTGRPLGWVSIREGQARIVGETEGLDIVDQKYGLVSAAISDVSLDMLLYFRQRHADVYRSIFAEAISDAA